MEESNEKSIYALLVGVAVGFASGAYLFSRKESSIRTKIEDEISHLYKSKVELDEKQNMEVDKIKRSIVNLLDDLSGRINKSMSDGKKD